MFFIATFCTNLCLFYFGRGIWPQKCCSWLGLAGGKQMLRVLLGQYFEESNLFVSGIFLSLVTFNASMNCSYFTVF